jgi:hypothetical protein
MPVQLDQVGAVDFAGIGPRAALVNPQQRIERFERAAMNIKCSRQQLADRRLPARFVDRLSIPGPKEQVIGLAAGFRVAAEEGPDIALETSGRRRCLIGASALSTFDRGVGVPPLGGPDRLKPGLQPLNSPLTRH